MSNKLCLDTALNVFCDASVTNVDNKYTSCPGYAVVYDNKIIKSDYKVIFGATNNYGEIFAIRMGIKAVIDKSYDIGFVSRINVFSDSQISVYGLREWIFSWYKNLDKNGAMLSSKREPIVNQEVYNNIVSIVVNEGIPLHIYHQLGHMNYNNIKHVNKVIESFNRTNRIRITLPEARVISYYNEYVDRFTRINLNSVINTSIFNQNEYKKYIIPVSVILTDDIMIKYGNLIYREEFVRKRRQSNFLN